MQLGRQISNHVNGQSLTLSLNDSYLGAMDSLTKREKGWFLFDWTECRNCSRKETCDKSCSKLKQIPDTVSEFIFEPGSSSGFIRFPTNMLIKNITDKVKSNDGKIIVNEMTTGIGRTGKWVGYNHYGKNPDMVAMCKGVGGGYTRKRVNDCD